MDSNGVVFGTLHLLEYSKIIQVQKIYCNFNMFNVIFKVVF
jgi:hypothetical protein